MPRPKRQGIMEAADGGIMEKDMRGGGFVPEGSKERADDVPARLSKNEFVMTADAVRAAGGGSVNKGAKRMYDMMYSLKEKYNGRNNNKTTSRTIVESAGLGITDRGLQLLKILFLQLHIQADSLYKLNQL